MVPIDRGIGNDLHQFHHPAVLMGQNVAVEHKLAGEIGKTGTHFEISGNDDGTGLAIAGAGHLITDSLRTLVFCGAA